MFLQLLKMYDEFRIQSFRVKITPNVPTVAAHGGNFMLHTAFDRNGMFQMATGKISAGYASTFWQEIPDNINSFSSLVSKQILQY